MRNVLAFPLALLAVNAHARDPQGASDPKTAPQQTRGLPPEVSARGLTDTTLDAWRDHILPTAQDSRWQAIPWRMSLHEGILEARRAGKPILLWTMNGHPFACT